MRITGGRHRSRKLESPRGDVVRPTSDKVRQAVFNMLSARNVIDDAIVIDGFSGTGALGLEALSRGASYCTFFDKNKESVALTKHNLESLGEQDCCQILLRDITKVEKRQDHVPPATLVFLDPPYRKGLVEPAIQALSDNNWLDNNVLFVIEIARSESLQSDLITIENEKNYGDTKILIAY